MKYLIGLLSFALLIQCTSIKREIGQKQLIEEQTNKIYNDLIDIRRDLHKNPELSGQEKRTSEIIANHLTDLGLEVRTNILENAVIGILKGAHEGKKIAWRADMDAIKIKTNDTSYYRSQNKGVSHMCGHDIHTTIGLGIANVLSHLKENLKGTVFFIFQPSEETFTGAKDLIDNGLFDIIKPDEIYGLHIGPAEKGIVNTKGKELFAYDKIIEVKLKPNHNEEEIKSFLTNIFQGFIRNKSNGSPKSLNLLTDVQLGLENKETIYQDYFILQNTQIKRNNDFIFFNASFLETSKEKTDSIPIKIKNSILNSKFKDSFISIKYTWGNPTVYNNPELTKIAIQTLKSEYSKELIKPIYGQIPYFNEDFIYYQQKVPGVLFLLGGSNTEKGIISMPHSPDFAIDEETIRLGVQCFSTLVMERANN